MNQAETVLLREEQLWAWGREALSVCNMPEEEKDMILDVLVTTNMRGVDTHGLNQLANYIERYNAFPPREIRVTKDDMATAMMDGGDNLGTVVSTKAMNLAMEKASTYGIGAVMAYNSGHFGAAAHYTYRAAEKGFAAYCATTAIVDIPPWGGMDSIAGKNPFSFSYPGDEFPVVLDVACSVVARQKVLTAAREGWDIPLGWTLDKHGDPTTDPNEALDGGSFLPMAEHKGIGIAVMIELICGCLCGTGFSIDVINTDQLIGPQDIAHIFVAMDCNRFSTKEQRDQQFRYISQRFHAGRMRKGVEKLYLPGELEWDTHQRRKAQGVDLPLSMVKQMDAYAEKIGVKKIRDC